KIRTSGLLNPIQARYQTAPHPDIVLLSRNKKDYTAPRGFCQGEKTNFIVFCCKYLAQTHLSIGCVFTPQRLTYCRHPIIMKLRFGRVCGCKSMPGAGKAIHVNRQKSGEHGAP
ncbi:MAG: hypothetical protein ACI4O8_08550, partial [Aristaeellaceae bacterium]